ncbi:MAG: ATP-binding protein [Burkholderiaceae bacterium]|nr:ATP-binding protein [Burkholderiaceae bacterium]
MRVLMAVPTQRDVDVTAQLLRKAGVCAVPLERDGDAISRQLHSGVGAVLLADDSLDDRQLEALLAGLAGQPPWSDVPVVLLTRDRERSPCAARLAAMLTNLTSLDLPVSTASMASAVLAALRARRRQYEIRDQLIAQQRAEQALRDADRRKDEFLATLAHELRNPLAPIRTGLQALGRLPPGEDAQATRLRQMMERQLQLLVKLIDELLDVSRISNGNVRLERERVDMRSVVEAALESSGPMLDAAGHELHVDLPDVPVWVLGDPTRLAQVVGNLLTNAAKYTSFGGSIRVVLRADGADAVVRVSDNGAGIPPEMLDQVFDLFVQVDHTRERAQGGLGIGLSLVRKMMTLHGGSVTAESPGLGRGSTFTVRLPTLGIGSADSSTDIEPRAGGRGLRRLRMLVVDDNVDAADTLVMLLEACGHEMRAAYSGTAALQLARQFRPDVVLCDIGLPRIDGYTVASRLRDDPHFASTLLVAVSGWGTEDVKRRSRNAGFDFHLVKPVDLESVNRILERL